MLPGAGTTSGNDGTELFEVCDETIWVGIMTSSLSLSRPFRVAVISLSSKKISTWLSSRGSRKQSSIVFLFDLSSSYFSNRLWENCTTVVAGGGAPGWGPPLNWTLWKSNAEHMTMAGIVCQGLDRCRPSHPGELTWADMSWLQWLGVESYEVFHGLPVLRCFAQGGFLTGLGQEHPLSAPRASQYLQCNKFETSSRDSLEWGTIKNGLKFQQWYFVSVCYFWLGLAGCISLKASKSEPQQKLRRLSEKGEAKVHSNSGELRQILGSLKGKVQHLRCLQ